MFVGFHAQEFCELLGSAAALVGTKPDGVVAGIERKLEELRQAQEELKSLRARLAGSRAAEMSSNATGGVVVERVDGLSANDLRELAIAVREIGRAHV